MHELAQFDVHTRQPAAGYAHGQGQVAVGSRRIRGEDMKTEVIPKSPFFPFVADTSPRLFASFLLILVRSRPSFQSLNLVSG